MKQKSKKRFGETIVENFPGWVWNRVRWNIFLLTGVKHRTPGLWTRPAILPDLGYQTSRAFIPHLDFAFLKLGLPKSCQGRPKEKKANLLSQIHNPTETSFALGVYYGLNYRKQRPEHIHWPPPALPPNHFSTPEILSGSFTSKAMLTDSSYLVWHLYFQNGNSLKPQGSFTIHFKCRRTSTLLQGLSCTEPPSTATGAPEHQEYVCAAALQLPLPLGQHMYSWVPRNTIKLLVL